MSSLDFRLQPLRQVPGKTRVHILLQYRNDLSKLESLGFQTTSVAGDVAAGSITADRLDQLQDHDDVVRVEATRSLKDELDASSVVIGLVDPATDHRTIPSLGAGAIIGVIDSGFDLTHPCFLNDSGKTRIMAAWDQVNLDNVQGAPPHDFKYGVEYTREAIDWDLANRRVVIVKNEKGAGGHGTNVAGIAAGNGNPDRIFKGMAPEAELILVTYRADVPIGGSAFLVDAIKYIVGIARAKEKPVVINISQGDNLGAHDGTSLLERAIDNVIVEGDVLVVVSAGNERNGPVSHHASGTVEQDKEFVVPFVIDDRAPLDGDTMELWYSSGDLFQVRLKTPSGWTSNLFSPGTSTAVKFLAGTEALVTSETNNPVNGDNSIGIVFQKGEGWETGTWELILKGQQVQRGKFDVWVGRVTDITVLGLQNHTDESTVTLPGNGRRLITVGSFVSRPAGGLKSKEVKGSIELGSSFGPTRDGRIKPDLVAPGALIVTPGVRDGPGAPGYAPRRGTSLAAPHVTGAVALMWSLWPALTSEQIHNALCATARRDMFTGPTPNSNYGHGKLDVAALYQRLKALVEKGTTTMADTQIVELALGPQPKKNSDEMAEMAIRIHVEDGNRVTIIGTSGDQTYHGTLILRNTAGGDECWVCDLNGENCHWENPCPH
jgi:subtilisin family serine protease